ncbi:MAG: response regulator [Anaerolineales bacterium]
MSKPIVLVADDDPDMLQLMARRLLKQGFEIDQAAEGRTALQKLETGAYDLVVTDIYMPGVSGLELLQQAKEVDDQTQVVVVTAGATLENAIEALNNGAFAYLIKPFDHFSVFDNVVSRALQFRRALLDNERMAEIQRRRGDMLEDEVTERVQQLQRRRREMLDLLASLPEGVLVVEEGGRIVMTNPRADEWLAKDRQQAVPPIQQYLDSLHEEWAADSAEVEIDGEQLTLLSNTLAGSGRPRKIVVIREWQAEAVRAIGPEEALDMLREGLTWLRAHPLQHAMQNSLAQFEILLEQMQQQVVSRPSTDELRRIEWSELDLGQKSQASTDAPGADSEDARNVSALGEQNEA